MSDLYSSDQPSDCVFSDACRFIIDLRKSSSNPFEHLDDAAFDLMSAELVTCARIIRQNRELLDSLEQAEISDLTRALYSLIDDAKEAKRYD